ncbi:uncharacterized protein LOC128548993 [Mercenaria mercenaria]|uniref:uncharacterized protein LOC128548993 n=1 Tax=Mercenaria mercenaria TaxID=6596 RepID=UPI00234E425D|nr:uncharacterized protein LOC128548993 [Mercenaria mercenaria]
MSFFWSKFKQAQSPLYLKLLLDEARKWKSFTPIAEMELMSTVKGAITGLFNNLEKKFGTPLVSHALGFVTIGLSGLTEFEINDALSCDDDVLNEVYRFHDPPVQGIVQIPPLLWAGIWYDIRGYLVERMSYGKTTLNWYHREFVLAATDMYTKGDNEVLLNEVLFEIHRQENGIKRTIKLQNRNQLEIIDADRQVTPQPYKDDNKRKLACLPYYTLRAYKAIGIDRAKAEVYCNFKYLNAKITAFSISAVVNDLSDFVEQSNDKEVKLLLNFIVNCRQDLTNQIRFAFCSLAYVNPENKHYQLKELLNDTFVFLESRKKHILIPEFPCLAQRRNASDAFQTSIQGISDILTTSSSNVLLQKQIETFDDEVEECQVQSDIAVWRTETQELINVEIQDDTTPVSRYILGDEYMNYITKGALVRYRYSDSKSETVLFKDIIAEWKTSNCVHSIFANSEATTGVLVQDCSITLINLERMEQIQEFKIPNKNLNIDNVFVLSSSQKLIAVGKNYNLSAKNQQPNSEGLSSVLVFEQGKDLPIQILEFEKHLDCKTAVLSCRDQWFLIPAERESMPTISENQTGPDIPGSGVQLLAFDIGESCFTRKEIKLPSAVSKISVHPEKRNGVVLSSNGQAYSVQENKFSAKAADLEIHLNFPIKVFTVSWEDGIGLFCSSGGKLAVYDLKSDNILYVFAAHSGQIKDICLLDQQLITLGEDKEMKSWAVKTLLQDTNTASNDTDLTEVNETLLEQTNVVGMSPSYNGMEFITCHDGGILKFSCVS